MCLRTVGTVDWLPVVGLVDVQAGGEGVEGLQGEDLGAADAGGEGVRGSQGGDLGAADAGGEGVGGDLGEAGHLGEGSAGEGVGGPQGGDLGVGGGTGWAVNLGDVQHGGGHVPKPRRALPRY